MYFPYASLSGMLSIEICHTFSSITTHTLSLVRFTRPANHRCFASIFPWLTCGGCVSSRVVIIIIVMVVVVAHAQQRTVCWWKWHPPPDCTVDRGSAYL